MARAALQWGVRDLAEKAGVTANTVNRFENGSGIQLATAEAIGKALTAAGVILIAENGGGAGVRFATPGAGVKKAAARAKAKPKAKGRGRK